MRGPLLSGAVGSPAALARLCQILRAKPPAVVLSSLWLARELAEEIPVVAVLEREVAKAARRALKKAQAAGHRLAAVVAGEALPLAPGRAGALVVESLLEIEDAEAVDFLLGLAATLRPDGVVVALDRTKDPVAEARAAGTFLAAGLTHIAQERPREGALLTLGCAPRPAVLGTLAPRPAA
jgi:hypothetical protein